MSWPPSPVPSSGAPTCPRGSCSDAAAPPRTSPQRSRTSAVAPRSSRAWAAMRSGDGSQARCPPSGPRPCGAPSGGHRAPHRARRRSRRAVLRHRARRRRRARAGAGPAGLAAGRGCPARARVLALRNSDRRRCHTSCRAGSGPWGPRQRRPVLPRTSRGDGQPSSQGTDSAASRPTSSSRIARKPRRSSACRGVVPGSVCWRMRRSPSSRTAPGAAGSCGARAGVTSADRSMWPPSGSAGRLDRRRRCRRGGLPLRAAPLRRGPRCTSRPARPSCGPGRSPGRRIGAASRPTGDPARLTGCDGMRRDRTPGYACL